MAWKPIDEFTGTIVNMIMKNNEALDRAGLDPENTDKRKACYAKDDLLCSILTEWYETLKAIPKFKVQRDTVRGIMFKFYPAYSRGYFQIKSDKPK